MVMGIRQDDGSLHYSFPRQLYLSFLSDSVGPTRWVSSAREDRTMFGRGARVRPRLVVVGVGGDATAVCDCCQLAFQRIKV